MLTKRQQQAIITMQDKGYMWPSCLFAGLLGTAWADYFAYMSAYAIMDAGLAAFSGHNVYLTPTGQRLATILAELPAPLTRRQWQILLRFRDVGSDSSNKYTSTFRAGNGMWQLPCTESEWRTWSQNLPGTNERTMRTLCDYGLIGFEYIPFNSTPYAHLTPLGEELVSLLP